MEKIKTLKVNNQQRKAKNRAHTTAHLLHLALNKILKKTKQAWSMVDKDYLRFDFTAQNPLTNEEIDEIEKIINHIISKGLNVEKKEMSFQEAIDEWAKAFFEEKYWEKVRVIKIKDEETSSIELCGGTHINNTQEIGIFKIVDQQAVASWIRRIIAYTWPKVNEYIKEKENLIYTISSKFDTNTKQLLPKIDKTLNEYQELKDKYHSLENKIINMSFQQEKGKKNNKIFDNIINISKNSELNWIDFKVISEKWKKYFENENSFLYKNKWNFCIIVWKWNISAQDIIQKNWLKWWWGTTFWQWKDPNIEKII